jgi:hypothetical protein
VSVVVERGLARCPRCVAVADYTFVESGPNSLRYEVHCRRCGEAYCEVHTPMAPVFTGVVDTIAVRPLVAPPSAFELRRRRAGAWFAGLPPKFLALTTAASSQVSRIIVEIRTSRR